MAFSEKQARALRAKLSHKHVRTRPTQAGALSYIEGWHAISEANRIFGYEGWDRQTQSPQCLWSDIRKGETACLYSTKVRISVRAGEMTAIREGIGTGFGQSASAEAAHEIAVKAAETDATKRALATFGNPFGLALYSKDHAQVTKPAGTRQLQQAAPLRLLLRHRGREDLCETAESFVLALQRALADLTTIEAVYAFWETNLASLCSISGQQLACGSDAARRCVILLQERLRSLANGQALAVAPEELLPGAGGSAAQQLAIPKERRVRDKDHLLFVASQPCLVCGRKPSQAHHLRFAQPRAMALKVSDEFTVPLCNIHHDQLHRAGDERAWWARNGIIDPLKFAHRLWHAPNKVVPADQERGSDPEPAGAKLSGAAAE